VTKKILGIMAGIVLLFALDFVLLFSSCSMDSEVEYVCKLIDDGEWNRNGWVMATSEDDALDACEAKYGDYNTSCSSCWQN